MLACTKIVYSRVDFSYLRRVVYRIDINCVVFRFFFFSVGLFFKKLLKRSYYFHYVKLYFNVERFSQYTFYKRKKRYFRLFSRRKIMRSKKRRRRLFKTKLFWTKYIKTSSYFKSSKVTTFLQRLPVNEYKVSKLLSFLVLSYSKDLNRLWLFSFYEKVFFFDIFIKLCCDLILSKDYYFYYLSFLFVLFYKVIYYFYIYSIHFFYSFYFFKSFLKPSLLKKT